MSRIVEIFVACTDLEHKVDGCKVRRFEAGECATMMVFVIPLIPLCDTDKKLRKAHKLLRDIQELYARKEAGERLEANQLKKLEREQAVRAVPLRYSLACSRSLLSPSLHPHCRRADISSQRIQMMKKKVVEGGGRCGERR